MLQSGPSKSSPFSSNYSLVSFRCRNPPFSRRAFVRIDRINAKSNVSRFPGSKQLWSGDDHCLVCWKQQTIQAYNAKTFSSDARKWTFCILGSWFCPNFRGANRLCKSKGSWQYKFSSVKVCKKGKGVLSG